MHASHASRTHAAHTYAYLTCIRMPEYACLSRHMPMRHTYTRAPHTYACLTHSPTSLYLVLIHLALPHRTSPHITPTHPRLPHLTSPHSAPLLFSPHHLSPPHCTHKAHTKAVHLCIYMHSHIHIHMRTPMRAPLGSHWVRNPHLSANHQAYAARPRHCTLTRTYSRTSAPALSPATRTLSPPRSASHRAGDGMFPRSRNRDRRWGAPKGECLCTHPARC